MVNSSLDQLPGKRRRTEEKVSVLLEPKFFKTCLVFQSDPGTSRGTPVDPTLRDNVLLPDHFAEYIYQGGLIPGGKQSQEGQAVSVFHSREPDVRQSRSGRCSIRFGQTQNYGLGEFTKIQHIGAI